MKKILIPVDFSEHTWVTVEYGLDMAKATEASILLFHSAFDQVILTAGVFPDSIASQAVLDMNVLQEIYKEAEYKMSELKARALEKTKGDIFIETSMVSGEPDLEIVKATLIHEPDIIIVGAVGQGRKDHFTGSTAEKLMKNTKIPVLAIPIKCGYAGMKDVLYAIDPDKACEPCILEVKEFFRPYGSHIQFLFIQSEEKHESTYRELKERLKDVDPLHLINCQTTKEGIYEAINRINPVLIAFHFHRESPFAGWFRPVLSRRDLYKANLPLLAFPEK